MVPKHIAIIMDGNGRWAKAQGKPRTYGHKIGSETLEQICKDAYDLGIKYVTVYAFSTENWSRSQEEVGFLMNLMKAYLKSGIKSATDNNMRVRVLGRRQDLERGIVTAIEKLEEASKNNDGLQLQLAINYGGRDEMVRAVRKIMEDESQGKIGPDQINESMLETYLDTQDIPDPELLIRTSGEYRTSNFMIWQLAYTEFYVTSTYWPDFSRKDLEEAIESFQKRDRRFGGVKYES